MMRFIYYIYFLSFFFLYLIIMMGLSSSSSFTSSPPPRRRNCADGASTVPVGLGEDVPILSQMASKYGMPVDVSEVSQKREDPPRRVCGYNLTPVPDERKLSSSNPKLGFVLYVKNQVKKKRQDCKKKQCDWNRRYRRRY